MRSNPLFSNRCGLRLQSLFLILGAASLLNLTSCSTGRVEWQHATEGRKVFLIFPRTKTSTAKESQLNGRLFRAAQAVMVDFQNKPKGIEGKPQDTVRQFDWYLNQNKLEPLWNALQAKNTPPNFNLVRNSLSPYLVSLPQLQGRHVLFLKVDPVQGDKGDAILWGYRLFQPIADEEGVEVSYFQTYFSTSEANLNQKLQKTLKELINSQMLSYPGFDLLNFEIIKGGCYQHGSPDPKSPKNERPTSEVCLSDFRFGKAPVTIEQWNAIMGSHEKGAANNALYPKTNVSYEAIETFIAKLNEKTGRSYRLPTEQEWEYVCRNRGQAIVYPNGKDSVTTDEANFFAPQKERLTTGILPVESFPANPLGVYGMMGNVWEWTSSLYTDELDLGILRRTSMELGRDQQLYTLKGGSFDSPMTDLRCTTRKKGFGSHSIGDAGFRLVLETP